MVTIRPARTLPQGRKARDDPVKSALFTACCMALIVQKFGGTSVGSVERIKAVARRVARWKAQGHQLVVVPSAMSGETNRLIALAKEVQASPTRASSTWSPRPASRLRSACCRWRSWTSG